MNSISSLLAKAEQIRIETLEDNNDAERIGSALKEIINFIDLTLSGVYDVTTAVPLPANQYYTATTARAAVPVAIRKKGLVISFNTSATAYSIQEFYQGEISAWATTGNWRDNTSKVLTALAQIQERLDTQTTSLQNQITGLSTGYVGALAYNASAPTPGKSGYYDFSTGGVCSWITGTPIVKVGDRVSVKYTAPSTYVYTHIPIDLASLDVYNVTALNPPASGYYYTETTARAAVPLVNRRRGLSVLYEKAAGVWRQTQFIGSTFVDQWGSANYWSISAEPSVINVTVQYPLDTDYYTLSTAASLVPLSNRRKGLKILYEVQSGIWRTMQYMPIDVPGWLTVGNWKETDKNYESAFDDTALFTLSGASTAERQNLQIKRAVKSISLPNYKFDDKIALLQCYPVTVDTIKYIVLSIYDTTSATAVQLFYGAVAAVSGIYTYTLPKYKNRFDKQIYITIDSNELMLEGIYECNPTFDYCLFRKEKITVKSNDFNMKKDYGIFSPYANFSSAALNSALAKAFVYCRISGNNRGRKFFLYSFSINKTAQTIALEIRQETETGDKSIRTFVCTAWSYAAQSTSSFIAFSAALVNNSIVATTPYRSGVSFDFLIDLDALPDGTIVAYDATYSNYVYRGIWDYVDGNQLMYQQFTSITKMLAEASYAPIQTAGNFEFRLTNSDVPRTIHSYELLHGKKRNTKKKPSSTVVPIRGFNSAGLATQYMTLADVGKQDKCYYIGVYDNSGMIYKADYGYNLETVANLKTQFPTLIQVYVCKELPSGELLINCLFLDSGVYSSKIIHSTASQTVFSICKNSSNADFTLSKYTNGTFQAWGTVKNGWSYDAHGEYILISEYGESNLPDGTTDPLAYDSVGYMRCGSAFLSTDGGVTFNEVFNYYKKTGSNYDYLSATVNSGIANYATNQNKNWFSNHIHGCFIDKYTKGIVPKTIISGINNDVYSSYIITVPRLVVITGDVDYKLLYSDDLGVTWTSCKDLFYYYQGVSGLATPKGYLITGDNVYPRANGIQLVHRAKTAANMDCDDVFTAMRQADFLNPLVNPAASEGTSRVYYCGASISRRDDESPIIAVFQPERDAYYTTEALRGCVAISYDEGISWERVYEDDINMKNIGFATAYQLSDDTILLSPVANYLNTLTPEATAYNLANPQAIPQASAKGGKIIEIKIK